MQSDWILKLVLSQFRYKITFINLNYFWRGSKLSDERYSLSKVSISSSATNILLSTSTSKESFWSRQVFRVMELMELLFFPWRLSSDVVNFFGKIKYLMKEMLLSIFLLIASVSICTWSPMATAADMFGLRLPEQHWPSPEKLLLLYQKFNPSGARVARLPRDRDLMVRPINCFGHIIYHP